MGLQEPATRHTAANVAKQEVDEWVFNTDHSNASYNPSLAMMHRSLDKRGNLLEGAEQFKRESCPMNGRLSAAQAKKHCELVLEITFDCAELANAIEEYAQLLLRKQGK
jgi:hypothetical protein